MSDDETSATITIRLTRADFDAGITSIENLGDVRRKTLREGGDEIEAPTNQFQGDDQENIPLDE